MRTRINPKTGKKQYKGRYIYIEDGKRKDAETGWFPTEAKAQKAANDAKKEKQKAQRLKAVQRQNTLFSTAFKNFLNQLEDAAKKEETPAAKTYFGNAQTIYKKYIPYAIGATAIKQVDALTFRDWVAHLNKCDIGGMYLHSLVVIVRKFNKWLSWNGYYIDQTIELDVETAIKRIKLKSRTVNNKQAAGLRHTIKFEEIHHIGSYLYKQGLGTFENYYWYVLFYFLFYSGLRVEELVALQWKFINLQPSQKKIYVKNAIPPQESVKHALQRVKLEQYRTKTTKSQRIIPIFDFYYQMLEDYKEAYQYEYGLTDQQLENAFVFPMLTTKEKNPNNYLKHKQLSQKVNQVMAAVGVEKTDSQMFRHSCATFLILAYPQGLGFDYNKVYAYFGHQDTNMLQKVYANIEAEALHNKMKDTFKDIFTTETTDEEQRLKQQRIRIIQRLKGDNEQQTNWARQNMRFQQIAHCISKGQTEYHYKVKDRWIIDNWIKENGQGKIKFIQV